MAPDGATEAPPRPLRADARRNRDKVLRAARAAYAADPDQVSLEAIARDAGVGIGTLYRHFPSRHDLLVALYQNDVDQLTASSEDTSQPPWEALVAWIDQFMEFGVTKRALLAEMAESDSDESQAMLTCKAQFKQAAATVLQRAQDAGVVRTDVAPQDVTRLVGGVSVSHGVPLEDARRLARIVLDGIRA